MYTHHLEENIPLVKPLKKALIPLRMFFGVIISVSLLLYTAYQSQFRQTTSIFISYFERHSAHFTVMVR